MITTPRKRISYDPGRDTEADIFVALTGSISADANNITVNADTLITKEVFDAGVLRAFVTIPTAPTASDDRKIGFSGNGSSEFAWFFVEGTALKCQVSNGEGAAESVTIDWSDGVIENWTNLKITMEVRWEAGSVRFFINGTQRAQLSGKVPRGPLSAFIRNANADNMLLAGLTVEGF